MVIEISYKYKHTYALYYYVHMCMHPAEALYMSSNTSIVKNQHLFDFDLIISLSHTDMVSEIQVEILDKRGYAQI